tara:strand:+ start:852 stop:1616 length:765 start_codon:yes stop_codon:yes gene_type:complete
MIIISPAKNLDFRLENNFIDIISEPIFINKTNFLAKRLKTLTASQLKNIMKISDKLSVMNRDRYNNFTYKLNVSTQKQAIFAFKGDTYKGFNINTFSRSEIKRTQKRLRILSGLYGLLKPLDLIQPYRLEMGSKISSIIGSDLYDFWSLEITKYINIEMKKSKTNFLINLASVEYSNVIDQKILDFKMVTPVFYQKRGTDLLNIGIISKRSRGTMAAYLIKKNISSLEDIKSFKEDGYKYDSFSRKDNKIFFVR